MSVRVASNSQESQDRRLKIKTLDQRMKRLAIDGSGLSPWSAEVLIETIKEVYFSDPDLRELAYGQLKYSCVCAGEGAGKPLSECQMVTVLLQMLCEEDREETKGGWKQGSGARRQRKIMRLTEEAREQEGLLTQEDLARLLDTDVRTIRRDIKELRQKGIIAATRGQQKDIGPGVSHRGIAVRLWLEGKDPVEICRAINHSIAAVENYLEKFKRVAYLRMKAFDDFQTAMAIGISVNAVNTFVELYHEFRNKSFFASRMEEIKLVGHQYYLAQDEKKDSGSKRSSSNEWRMP